LHKIYRMADNQYRKEGFQIGTVIYKIVSFLIQGFAVGLAAFLIARTKNMNVSWDYVVLIGFTAAAVMAILGLYAPQVNNSLKFGLGAGLGANLVGFPAGPNFM
jgi:hypothetical protein